MQSICGEIFFLFFKLDCWFTVEWWENKAVPAECWGEAFICFIDLVHFCEMFSMYFSFGYKMYPQMIVAAIKLHYPGEQLQKESLEFANDFFFFFCFGKAFCWEKHCPLDMGRGKCNLCTFFGDLGWFGSVTIWEYEQNKSFAFQARTRSSLFSKKPGRSQVLTPIQERLGFQIWSCWPWILYFLSEGNSFLFKNKMTILLPTEKIFMY